MCIRDSYNPDDRKLQSIEFIPYKQIYPSTVIADAFRFNTMTLRHNNPMQIVLYKDDDGKFVMEIGRENMYGITTKDEDAQFRNNYNQEVKEFLQSIERETWYSPNIQFRNNQVSEKTMMEFLNQVNDIAVEQGFDPIVLE